MSQYVILYTASPEVAKIEGIPQRGLVFHNATGMEVPFIGSYDQAVTLRNTVSKCFPESSYKIMRLEELN